MRIRKILLLGLIVCLLCTAAGCSKIREASGHMSAEEGFEPFSAEQMYLILAGRRSEIAAVYTDQIFSVPMNDRGTTYEDNYENMGQDYIRKLEVLCQMAEARGMTLTGTEERALESRAKTYMEDLAAAGDRYGIAQEDACRILEELEYVTRLRSDLVKEAEIEVSESEARVMDICRIELSDSEKAYEVLKEISDGEDFERVAQRSSENAEIRLKVGKGDLGSVIDEMIFDLEDGEISPVIQAGGKYYIIQVVRGYDEEATLAKKERMTILRENTVIGSAYTAYVAEHSDFVIDPEAWKKAVEMLRSQPEIPDIFTY